MPDPAAQPAPFRASDHAQDNTFHILIACSGSVATIKLPLILRALSTQANLSIRLILTTTATCFLQGQSAEQPTLESLLKIPNVASLHLDSDEWEPAWTRSAPVLHIELRRWADALLVAPLSADMLAKVALGLSDSLLSCVLRAWDTTGRIDLERDGVGRRGRTRGGRKRVWVAPAMNTAMWVHPVTRKHLAVLEGEWGEESSDEGWIKVLRPVEKGLACGDIGGGAMMEWSDIVAEVERELELDHHTNGSAIEAGRQDA